MGACLQASLLIILPSRVAIAPAVLLLSGRALVSLMTLLGALPDSSMKDVRVGRYSAQIPRLNGSFSEKASDQDVVVMILGAQSNQYVEPTAATQHRTKTTRQLAVAAATPMGVTTTFSI